MPGTATFVDDTAEDTTATFSEVGVYVLRLTADDTALTGFGEVTITVENLAPTVDAGQPQTIVLPAGATLDGTVTDDGLPAPPTLTTTWSQTSGPGTTTFGDVNVVDTTATFSEVGVYVLRLTADDTALTAFAEVTITVNNSSPPITVTFIEEQNGYVGTQDAMIRGAAPTSSRGATAVMGWNTNDDKSTLLRFDNVFGSGVNQVPEGATIESAMVTVEVYDGGPDANVFEVVVDWDESITFNTFGGSPGVQPEDLGAQVSVAGGDLSTGPLTIDVTASVQGWTGDPSANRGWIFVPSASNNVKVRSSESGTIAERPLLSITYTAGN